MILASFGLGSFTMSMWFARYRWVFMALTFVFLAFAYYKTYHNKKSCGFWSCWMLHGTTVLSLGMVIYTLLHLQS